MLFILFYFFILIKSRITKNYESGYERESFMLNATYPYSNGTFIDNRHIRVAVVKYLSGNETGSLELPIYTTGSARVRYEPSIPVVTDEGGVKLYYRTCYDEQKDECVKNAEKSEIKCSIIFTTLNTTLTGNDIHRTDYKL